MPDDGTPEEERMRDVTLLARTDPERAARMAAAIEDPAVRAEAFAWAARYAAPGEVVRLAEASMDAAGSAADAEDQVRGSAPAVRALVERDRPQAAQVMLELALAAMPRVPRPPERAEVVLTLLHAAFDLGEPVRRMLLYVLADLHDRHEHWRVERALREALVLVRDRDPDFVERLAHGRTEDADRQIRAAVAAAEPVEPRRFFW